MLKNVQIYFADRVPEPTLYEVIEKLSLLKPKLRFVHDKGMVHNNSNRPIDKPYNESRDTGKSYATRFNVMDGDLHAGTIHIGSYYTRRSGAKNWRIGVTAHTISNGRGAGNTTYTSDVNKAVSNAKKFLAAKSIGRILYEAYEEAQSVARDVTNKLVSPVARGNFLTGVADAQALLHAYMTNTVSHVPDVDTAMRAKLLTPAFEKALSEFYLARFFAELVSQKQTIFIHRFGAGYAFFSDVIPNMTDESDKAAVTVMEFEQLPIVTQERLGVLQLMQDHELVKDVGLRVNEDSFILM